MARASVVPLVLGAALVAPAAGCDLRFTDPRGETPARLALSVAFDQGSGDLLHVQGSFLPGTDEVGRVRPVTVEPLFLGEGPLYPTGVREDGGLRYEGEVGTDAAAAGLPLDLRGPEVEGVDVPAPVLRFAVCRRVGGNQVQVDAGGVVRLASECPGGPGLEEPEVAQWELRVGPGSEGAILRLQGSGDPPSPLELPEGWLPSGEEAELSAMLTVVQAIRWEGPMDRYRVSLTVVSRVEWTVLVS